MAQPMYLALAIHNHQPVGNFGFVFAEACEKAYLPMVTLLEKHPTIRLALHYSGPLRDWLVANRPDFMPRVKALASRGQIEIMTGGYYEPILVSIPDDDKLGQIHKLSDAVRDDFAYSPTGAWLAERVWEPQLAKTFNQAGVDYVIVDDTHFRHVGLADSDLFGYYVTEEQGYPLKIFGTSKHLRYSIPWKPVDEAIAWLYEQAEQNNGPVPRVAVMGDDGEKFGLWPMTYQHVWENGWFEDFFRALEENSDWLQTISPGEYARRFPAIDRVYLPTASYDEMTEWALPAGLSADITRVKHELQNRGEENILQFIHGGFWRNFLVKYPEVNNMHKKMLRVHDKVYNAGKEVLQDADRHAVLDNLWAAQCNCPYWHGVFGGIYLPHIRRANYEHLIAAENLVDKATRTAPAWVEVTEMDFTRNSHQELLVETPDMILYFQPSSGGALFEWDWRAKKFNLLNNLTRRKEGYHRDLIEASQKEEQGQVKAQGQREENVTNIHDSVRSKEEGLANYLFYDWYQRTALLDHFLHADVSLESFYTANYGEAGDFVNQPYQSSVALSEDAATVTLSRNGHVWMGDVFSPVLVEKQLTIPVSGTSLSVVYTLTNTGEVTIEREFGVEFNFGLLSGQSDDAYYEIPGVDLKDDNLNSMGELTDVSQVNLFHEWFRLHIQLAFERPATLWRMPIETVSNSEGGFERVYQCSCVFPHWKVHLAPDDTWKVNLTLGLFEPVL